MGVGSTAVSSWKIFKVKHKFGGFFPSITKFGDITAKKMTNAANSISDAGDKSTTRSSTARSSTATDSVSLVSFPCNQTEHIQEFIPNKKQVRCIWCSRVGLVDQKVTMKCKECNAGFCRPAPGINCWSKHICLGGVPQAPEKGTKRWLLLECDYGVIIISIKLYSL